jgi:ABC-type oligopeptide transport system ATPase subunit
MSEEEKHLTEAEKQIRRLEIMRQNKEHTSKETADKVFFPAKTEVQRTTDRLKAMKDQARPAHGKRPRFDGKRKSAKLTLLQVKVLEEILSKELELSTGQLMRVAMNRLLEIENTADENAIETKVREILKQIKNPS